MDHGKPTTASQEATYGGVDVNRQRCIDVGLLKIIHSILTRYVAVSGPTIDDLKVAKTAVGALLNSCFGFGMSHLRVIYSLNFCLEPSRAALIALGTPDAVIQLSLSLYPPARWAVTHEEDAPIESLTGSYQLRIGLTDWAWRLVSAITEGGTLIRQTDPTLLTTL